MADVAGGGAFGCEDGFEGAVAEVDAGGASEASGGERRRVGGSVVRRYVRIGAVCDDGLVPKKR